jgi:hypothetical protein
MRHGAIGSLRRAENDLSLFSQNADARFNSRDRDALDA